MKIISSASAFYEIVAQMIVLGSQSYCTIFIDQQVCGCLKSHLQVLVQSLLTIMI
jgi:hypothetical protein